MKAATVKLTVEIPLGKHTLLKTECSRRRIRMNQFVDEWITKGLEELQKQELHDGLAKSIQQAKEGKLINKGSFAKYVQDEI